LWPDLTFAVENHLGGPDSADKRNWFAGSVAELFPPLSKQVAGDANGNQQRQPDINDLLQDAETRLLQVMDDEFDAIVDDGSAFEIAEQVVLLWRECGRGDFRGVDRLQQRWEAAKGSRVSALFKEGETQDQDTDWDSDNSDEEDEDGDIEISDTPYAPKEKQPPEVDDDGFTKVTGRRR
jgi:pre-rRNA-processing protein TSR2